VFDSAKRLSTRWFTVLYRPSRPNKDECARLGLVISKKSAKRAVDRNRVKRQLRETFRLNQHQLPKFDVVMLSKRGIPEADNKMLLKELSYIWQKLSRMA